MKPLSLAQRTPKACVSNRPWALADGTTPRVLVVCDHPEELSALPELLTDAGLEFLVVTDDQQDVLESSNFWPDLILLDLLEPGCNALATCDDLRGIPSLADVPILFAAAPTDHSSRSAYFAAGAVDSLSKPFAPEEVLARIKIHLELGRLRRAQKTKGHLERSTEIQLEQALAQAILIVNPAGRIVFCSRSARDLLKRHLKDFDPTTTLLPSILQGGSFPKSARHSELRARRFHRVRTGDGESKLAVLLLEEQAPEPSLILLNALKLTRCEANVLYWVREGKTSPEIATILGAALSTVKKHLEHVYEKLGVETRTAAALLASEVLQRHQPA